MLIVAEHLRIKACNAVGQVEQFAIMQTMEVSAKQDSVARLIMAIPPNTAMQVRHLQCLRNITP
ncbi:hypothetical protein WJ63_37105 [Burkholderia pyrrocinia]|nr:hypothetical protein WJ63_37105 [Burkholderia pyrrocinia]